MPRSVPAVSALSPFRRNPVFTFTTVKFLADENVRRRLVRWLLDEGHNVTVVTPSAKDPSIVPLATAKRRVLISNDTDFLDVNVYPPRKTPGRIVLRVFPDTLENQRESLAVFLSSNDEKVCKGVIIVLWKGGFFEAV